jgi:hypothetical protein
VVDGFFCTPGCAKRTVYEKSAENQTIINQCNILYQEEYSLDFAEIVCTQAKQYLNNHTPEIWSSVPNKTYTTQKPFKPAVKVLVDNHKHKKNLN